MSTNPRVRIVAVGGCGVSMRFAVDRPPATGETVMANNLMILNGGKAANHAIGAARLGAQSYLVSAVGDDIFSTVVLKTMEGCGVERGGIATIPGSSTMIGAVIVNPSGDNQIIVGPGVLNAIDEAVILRNEKLISAADVCLVSLEIPTVAAMTALRLGRTAGVKTVLNLSPVPSRDQLAELITLADVLVVNENEARAIVNGGREDAIVVREIVRAGAKVAIMTLGSAGALLATSDQVTYVPAVPVEPDKIIDTAGAGDAFLTALAVAIAKGFGLPQAIAIGAEGASRILRGPGFLEALSQWEGFEISV